MYSCYIVIISPWKRAGSSFEQTWTPFTQRCFVPSIVEIDPVDLEQKINKWKVYANDDDNLDDGQRTSFDQKSSLEPSA